MTHPPLPRRELGAMLPKFRDQRRPEPSAVDYFAASPVEDRARRFAPERQALKVRVLDGLRRLP